MVLKKITATYPDASKELTLVKIYGRESRSTISISIRFWYIDYFLVSITRHFFKFDAQFSVIIQKTM